MKALIAGLLSLAVLAGCATPTVVPKSNPLPPAAQGFCNANDGIFVVWVNDKGEKNAFLCPMIKGKEIFQEEGLRDGLVEKLETDLGTVKKWGPKDPNNPDPCVHWVAGGSAYYFCW
jgi:hypothetical protein